MVGRPRGQTTILPLVAAVGLTVFAGYYLKNQRSDRWTGRTQQNYGAPREVRRRVPRVEVADVDVAKGPLPQGTKVQTGWVDGKLHWFDPPPVKAYAKVALTDDGKPRGEDWRYLGSLLYVLRNEKGEPVPITRLRGVDSEYVVIPEGQPVIAKKLTLEVRSNFKRWGPYDFPVPAPPKRVLTPDMVNADELAPFGLELEAFRNLATGEGNKPTQYVMLSGTSQGSPEELFQVRILRHSYGEVPQAAPGPRQAHGSFSRGGPASPTAGAVVPLPLEGPDLIELEVSKLRAYNVKGTLRIDWSLEDVFGQPSLKIHDSEHRLSPDLALRLRPFDAYPRRQVRRIQRTRTLLVGSDDFVWPYRGGLRLVSPRPPRFPLSIQLVPSSMHVNADVPGRLSSASRIDVRYGEQEPMEIEYDLWPFKRIDAKRFVIPVGLRDLPGIPMPEPAPSGRAGAARLAQPSQ